MYNKKPKSKSRGQESLLLILPFKGKLYYQRRISISITMAGPHAPVSPNRCGSRLVQTIDAPLAIVWSLVRRFDQPQAYKQFVKSCTMVSGGHGGVGSVRDVVLVSGLPASSSTERLDGLDDESHVMTVSFIGGNHRLVNYRSTTTLHRGKGAGETVVTESYVVDVPADSNKVDTCLFADSIIGFNLRSLARVSENMARL